jgi:hypothetical protein
MLGAYLNKFVINLVGVSPWYTVEVSLKQHGKSLRFVFPVYVVSTLSNHFLESRHFLCLKTVIISHFGKTEKNYLDASEHIEIGRSTEEEAGKVQ